jgi:YVTN family beta-propeller protein
MVSTRLALRVLPLLVICALPSITQSPSSTTFVNFEAAFTSPIRLSADGTRLYTVNNPNATLSVFNVSGTAATSPQLIAQIPVGIEPVSVNPRTDDEVWVVNQESDSVSVVSVSKGIVTDTIQAKDEPADVVFAGSYAFVSAARNNQIYVFNASTHALVQTIPVFGDAPRAMAVSADGTTVYAAMALSGNQTTAIPFQVAPPPPPPVNPALPPAPQQDVIVTYNDPAWSAYVTYTMPDNDVVAINSSTLAIDKYYSGVGTINQAIAVQPSTGNLFVANMDALNLIRFETNLNGHFVNNRITEITPSSGTTVAYDLNAGFTYTDMPNSSELSLALAEPTSIVFDSTGQNMYVAAFGTDRVAEVSTAGAVLARIEIDPNATGANLDTANKRGPRGLAINTAANVLYVMNRISNTISIVNTSTNTVLSEIPTGTKDPTPSIIKQGRGFLYDAKLSGSGTGSCGSCHIDGEADKLAWDLGDPTGTMQTVSGSTVQDGGTVTLHPMKGPMVTMVLRGLLNEEPYHWRGDHANFAAFNSAFQSLLGSNQLSTDQMTAYTNFINTIVYMPNPNENLDRSLQTSLAVHGSTLLGNPVNGQNLFQTILAGTNSTCNDCHRSSNGLGSSLKIQVTQDEPQVIKVPQLRITYQKQLFTNTGGPTIDGFGITTEGDIDSLPYFFSVASVFPGLVGKTQDQIDIAAYNLSFDTGVAPSVGYALTLNATSLGNSQIVTNWGTLESQSAVPNCDLVANGTVKGAVDGLVYNPTKAQYVSVTAGLGPFTHAQLVSLIQDGDTLTVMGVPHGSSGLYAAARR